MRKAILIIKGNYTQRQFDAIGKLVDTTQNTGGVSLIQISESSNVGLIKIDNYGDVTIESMFNEKDE